MNGLRGDLPLCLIDVSLPVSYTSTNGAKIGMCKSDGQSDSFTGKGFEVPDYLKGDIARSYFYLATCYWNKWTCCDEDGVNGSDIKPWMERLLRKWSADDPVDQYEMDRNDKIYANWQHNRNPFIDHPEWVDEITDF